MKRLCTICARGGSQGLPNKNTKELLGKPLIAHTIQQAKTSKMFDTIAVSSDSEAILDIANNWGADFTIKRPSELASDKASKLDAIKHCLQETENLANLNFDTVVDLDATSPLRRIEDIKSAIKILEDNQVSNVITGVPARRSPYFNLVELDNNNVAYLSKTLKKPITCRQDSPPCFDMNASIYVWQKNALISADSVFLEDTALYVMPEWTIDIDSELDFEVVEFLAKKRGYLL